MELLASGLRESGEMFWETLWALVLGFSLSGAVQAFVSRGEMKRLLGDAGPLALLRATGFGAASSSCSYASAAMAKSLFADGADFVTAMVFMFASTNLVIELGIVLAVLIGWQFTASECFGGILMIVLFVMTARVTISPALIEGARARLGATTVVRGVRDDPSSDAPSLRTRLRSRSLWRAAAGYAFADLRMLRKEIAGGFLVAGFLAALVPAAVWRDLFLSGHGLASSVENAAIGPLIAMLSFVCSVGNVPLAAALWKGGISFGGVASFLYADLITLPLLLIYRKYYGGRLTLRLVGTFWLVMSAAGLATQYLFQALGAVPRSRPHQIAFHAFGWNPTSGLDLVALLLMIGGFLLVHRAAPDDPEGRFALDPVCGMQVERSSAPARLTSAVGEIYFCSDRCRDRFQQHPERFSTVGSDSTMPPPSTQHVDPVCKMPVEPASAGAHLIHQGEAIWFCSLGCLERFRQDPDRYHGGSAPTAATEDRVTELDPVCGMEFAPTAASPEAVHEGRRFYFCSSGCRERFLQHPESFSRMRSLTLPSTQPEFPIDPICGMSVDPADPGAKLEFPGETVYFCCQPCADEYAAARPVRA
ncbi:MAG: permease [Candidatus Dormiibacterota bacterium]